MIFPAALLAAAALLCAGCAKIGEPQPPGVEVPEAATDLTAKQISDRVVLTVSTPDRNTSGAAVTSLRSLEVYRLAGNSNAAADALPDEDFARQAAPVFSIPASRFAEYRNGSVFTIEDGLLLPNRSSIYSRSFRYAVLFVNDKNQAAGFSNQAVIAPVAIPAPLVGVSARVAETFIHLTWTPPSENMDGSRPARIAGYKVYRSEDERQFPAGPAHSGILRNPEFKDEHFQFEKTYFYWVSVVGNPQDPYAESLPSEAAPVSPKDVFAPAPPEDFHAVLKDGTVYLLWTPSSSSDAAGCRIYRIDGESSEKRLLNPDLIVKPSFQDRNLETRGKYEYLVTAVDAQGNESAAARTTIEVP